MIIRSRSIKRWTQALNRLKSQVLLAKVKFLKEWMKANKEFIEEQFGSKNKISSLCMVSYLQHQLARDTFPNYRTSFKLMLLTSTLEHICYFLHKEVLQTATCWHSPSELCLEMRIPKAGNIFSVLCLKHTLQLMYQARLSSPINQRV